MQTLTSPDQLAALVAPDVLGREGFPKPRRVMVTEVTDSTGEDAYYVWVVYADKTPESQLSHKKIQPMRDWIRAKIREAGGDERRPYVQVKLESHLPEHLR